MSEKSWRLQIFTSIKHNILHRHTSKISKILYTQIPYGYLKEFSLHGTVICTPLLGKADERMKVHPDIYKENAQLFDETLFMVKEFNSISSSIRQWLSQCKELADAYPLFPDYIAGSAIPPNLSEEKIQEIKSSFEYQQMQALLDLSKLIEV